MDVETNEQVIQDVEFNFIELPKFTKTISQLKTNVDQWAYFIKNAENLSVIPENVKDEGLKEAYIEADKQNWTKAELEDYERASIKERDEIGRIEFAEKKARNKQKIEIAKQAKIMRLSIADISKLTGLTEEEIEKL